MPKVADARVATRPVPVSGFGRAGGGGRRMARRQQAPLVATIATLSSVSHAILMDLSASGARLKLERPPEVGREVHLSVARLKVHGSVCWTASDQCGLSFSEPLSVMQVRHVLHEAAVDGAMKPEVRAARAEWFGGKPH